MDAEIKEGREEPGDPPRLKALLNVGFVDLGLPMASKPPSGNTTSGTR